MPCLFLPLVVWLCLCHGQITVADLCLIAAVLIDTNTFALTVSVSSSASISSYVYVSISLDASVSMFIVLEIYNSVLRTTFSIIKFRLKLQPFHSDILPSFLSSFIPSFLPPSLPSILPSSLPSYTFLPSLLAASLSFFLPFCLPFTVFRSFLPACSPNLLGNNRSVYFSAEQRTNAVHYLSSCESVSVIRNFIPRVLNKYIHV